MATILIIFLIMIGAYAFFHKDDQWTVDDLYGEWKVTELVQKSKGSRGLLPLGNETGRSFIISENQIIDSKTQETAEREGQVCYSLQWSFCEGNVYEDGLAFQMEHNIYLQQAGITSDVIYEFVFGEEASSLEFCVFSYDKERMVIWLHGGYYILERFDYMEKSVNPYGKWYVERLISRGTGEQEGIDFFHRYGMCYQLDETSIKRGYEEEAEDIVWNVEKTNRTDFEKSNGIIEGLGIYDQEIEVWYAYKGNEVQMTLIPVHEDEIIMQIGGQWFQLGRIPQYDEPKVNVEEVMRGEWKYTQFLGEEAENVDTQDIALAYTTSVVLDPEMYVEGAISEVQIGAYKWAELLEETEQIDFLRYFFRDDDIVYTMRRNIYDKEQLFVLIDQNTMLCRYQGMWFRIENIVSTE